MPYEAVATGERVVLREMTAEDQPSFHAWLQDPELRALVDDQRIPSLDDQAAWFCRANEGDRRFFSIVALPENILIGNCGFVEIIPDESAMLRITIGNPDYIGKGYGPEAIGLLCRYGFASLHLKEIRLSVLASNERAVRAYEKAGFVVREDLSDDPRYRVMIRHP